jgi:hypothetical protein
MFERIPLPKEFAERNIDLVADEEGKYRHERLSLLLVDKEGKFKDAVSGNAIFVGVNMDKGRWTGLDDSQLNFINDYFIDRLVIAEFEGQEKQVIPVVEVW